jgi:hypothetical protein
VDAARKSGPIGELRVVRVRVSINIRRMTVPNKDITS